MCFSISHGKSNKFCNLDKEILQIGEIHYAISTNTFYDLEDYILQFGQIHYSSIRLEAVTNSPLCRVNKSHGG